ncbi:MAG: TonB-dependent receptor plug domain-containing protein [Bacteroidales bacterium]|jgi:hypothetical protein|nr:TonB-dependent receptor plug domain-containing protein [Bacteroidales bacterium]
MKKLLFLFLTGLSAIAAGQSILDSASAQFNKQLVVFPQEKIHVHTDKPYYISGERIWFRAHLVDAVSHKLDFASWYIYVELINPLDIIINRVKIRQDEKGVYSGNIVLPDDLPEGNYTLRAYTNFMRNLDEDYFFIKNIFIGDPQSRLVDIQARFEYEAKGKVQAEIRTKGINLLDPIIIESVKMRINNGKEMTLKTGNDGIANVTFDVPPGAKQRIMLIEVTRDNGIYRKYIPIPLSGSDFDVSFFPEGGQIISGTMAKVAFKALKPDGNPEDITGHIYDQDGNNMGDMISSYRGTGSFIFQSVKGKTYHAICRNSIGVEKRFELPATFESGYSLGCNWNRDKLYVTLHQPGNQTQEPFYLLAHVRGMVYYAESWDFSKEWLAFPKQFFPSGVLHLLLLDKQKQPVSERLVFVNNDDQAVVHYQTDREKYGKRSLVKNTVTFDDQEGNPLSGSFSVSVTDDNEVITDSTSNILTNLLLTSDLRGNIEDPGFYFRENPSSVDALDLLMLTQGWRRYNIGRIMKGDVAKPSFPLEVGPEISGTVKSLLWGKPAEGIGVSMMAMSDSTTHRAFCIDQTITDKDGRFYLHNCELRDSTRIIVQADRKAKTKRFEVSVNEETFPDRTLLIPPINEKISREVFEKYANKAEEMYIAENGMRSIYIKEVKIVAPKITQKSDYYQWADYSMTEDMINKMPASSMFSLIQRIPGIWVTGNGKIEILRGGAPLIVVDGDRWGKDPTVLDMLDPSNIAQIDLLKPGHNTTVFGPEGNGGVIVIFTKRGAYVDDRKQFNIKSYMPLGYQSPVEFYAPKYDTPAARSAPEPDLRTTIHWQPNVQTDSIGVASFYFYTADAKTTYTVIMEGITDDGKIIRQESKILTNDK